VIAVDKQNHLLLGVWIWCRSVWTVSTGI